MRTSILILAATSCCFVDAGWVKLPGHRGLAGRGGSFQARETRAVAAAVDGIRGWTPRPTPPPGAVSESDAVLELLKRATSSNTWLDDTTCGWTAGVASAAFTCAPRQTCSTNNENVVACVSGTNQPFFTVCFDYQAFQQGSCISIGSKTGCCTSQDFGSCGTFLWTGSPPRSMYRCFPTQTLISMIDEPQEVLDALYSTKSSTTSSSATSSSSPSATTDADDHGGSSSNTGAIVGGVVGGLAALGLIAGAIAWIVFRNKRKNKQTYNPVPPADPSNPGAGGQYQAQTVSTPGSSTFPPTAMATAVHPGAYDPRQSYYDPAKQPPGHAAYTGYPDQQQQQQHLYPGQSPPVSPPIGTAGYNPHHSVFSELSGDTAPVGHQANPVEIGTEK